MATPPAVDAGATARRPRIAADLLLQSLSEHGVEYFFANSGTDFAPVAEAFSRAAKSNARMPRPVLVPHENCAMAMAHGVYLMTGRPQALMVHVNVGTANTIAMLANFARDRAPIVLMAGRNPITEKGHFGSRNRPIHWAQEMFDQGSMVRELVKWDYELRMPDQAGDVVARAFEVAMAAPRGPVYLTLPREPMAATITDASPGTPRPVPAPAHPDPASIETLAQWIATHERPYIITSGALTPDAVEALSRLAEMWAIPVAAHVPRGMTLPSSHPMHFGYNPGLIVSDTDLVIALECDVPWYPVENEPPAGSRIVHLGEDPVFQRYPMRSFRSDLAIAAGPAGILRALIAALAPRLPAAKALIDARRARLAAHKQNRIARLAQESAATGDTITPPVLSRMIGETFADAIIFNESALMLDHCRRETPGTFFGLSPAGGLGWGLGAALGAKLAAPDKLIVATLGDGAYLFANPTVGNWVAGTYGLPVVAIIFNNSRYAAVRRATLSMFKDGAAGENDGMAFADLGPSPAYEELARAQGAFGERVDRVQDLAGALTRARDAVLNDRRPALLNVICPY